MIFLVPTETVCTVLTVSQIQYTATSEIAWDGIEGTDTCSSEGLCNPQYVFYRDGYNIVLSTWRK